MKKLKFILNILIFILGISTLLLITIPLFLKYGEKFIEEKENLLVKFGEWIMNKLEEINVYENLN